MSKVRISSSGMRKLKPFIVSFGFGAAAALVLLAVFALVISKMDVPAGLISFFSAVSIGVGCLISGLILGKVFRKNGLFFGAVAGVVMFLVIALISLMFGSAFSGNSIIKLIIAVTAGAIGGVAGVNSRARRY